MVYPRHETVTHLGTNRDDVEQLRCWQAQPCYHYSTPRVLISCILKTVLIFQDSCIALYSCFLFLVFCISRFSLVTVYLTSCLRASVSDLREPCTFCLTIAMSCHCALFINKQMMWRSYFPDTWTHTGPIALPGPPKRSAKTYGKKNRKLINGKETYVASYDVLVSRLLADGST